MELYKPYFKQWDLEMNASCSRRRILWLLPWLNMGGADKFNLDTIRGLKERGFLSYIATTVPGEQEWEYLFAACAEEIFHLPDFLEPERYIEFVSYVIQSRGIQVLLVSNSYRGYYMLPWLRQHFPFLVIVDYVHMEEWYWRNGGYARVSGMLGGILEKTYVCNSCTKEVLVKAFGRDEKSVEVLYIGVDEKLFQRQNYEPGYLHQMLHISEKRPIILFPCRIHPQKRPFLMLEIAREVKKKRPDAAFVAVGDGPQLAELKKMIKKRKLAETVFCTGKIQEMGACYRDAYLTLICSLKEGIALTAYESCSMQVPVISSDVGGQRDLIKEDMGVLIPVKQEEDRDLDNRNFAQEEIKHYSDAVLFLLEHTDVYAVFSQNSRKRIEEFFSQKKMIRRMEEEIEFLSSDFSVKEERERTSVRLQELQGLASDYYTIEQNWESMQDEKWSFHTLVKKSLKKWRNLYYERKGR